MHKTSSRTPEKSLTDADYQAADEVLHRIPELSQNVGLERARESLAASHQKMGNSRFRFFWNLREPENCCEILERQVMFGHKLKAEFEEHLLWHIDNDLTSAKLARYFDELFQEVRQYADIRRDIEGYVYGEIERPSFSAFEEEINDRVEKLQQGSTFYRKEREYLPLFLFEARVEHDKGPLQVGSLSANTAAALVALTLGNLKQGWVESYGRSRPNPPERVPSPFTLVEQHYLRYLPSPLQLSNWLEEEHVLGRRYLRTRAPHAPASQQVVADYVGMVVQNMSVSITASQPPVAPTSEVDGGDRPTPLLTVDDWSELAIGIDFEHGYWYALKGVELGHDFPKKQAIKLIFRHDGWDDLLKWLAESPDNQTISFARLVDAWYRPPCGMEADRRGRRSAQQMAMRDELSDTIKPSSSIVKDKLKELRRELREFVEGPTEIRRTCLRKVGKNIRAGFRVAFLVDDGTGHSYFGPRRS